MANVGEELVGAYLKACLDCDFVDYNVYTRDTQGEIDIVGINFKDKKVYICEAATHPITGLYYKNQKSGMLNNVNKISEKFDRSIAYGKKYYKDFEQHYMLWSPVVKKPRSPNAKGNQMRDVEEIKKQIRDKYHIDLELVINENYLNKLNELRNVSNNTAAECKSVVMRLLQIEEWTKKHVNTIEKRKQANQQTQDKPQIKRR